MQINLKVLAGPYKGSVYTFDQPDTFLIGRTNDSHLCLPDDRFFSRHHCLLEISPPRCFLRDLGSTNGTFVNGQRVSEAFLKNGDQIQGGATVLLVQVIVDSQWNSTTVSGHATTQPVLIQVECLKCGRREETQATAPDEHMTFLCEDCRIELKRTPQPVPGYEMVRVLGRGGMGCVMLGRDEKTGRAVAIKTMLPEFAVSDKAMRRFIREIDVAAALKHPNIVEFLDRDFKDQNVLVTGSWPNVHAKLTDFGLAKSFTQSGMSGVTMAGEMAGTLAYMPPEQLRNFRDVRPQSDIYAVGMTAYSLLTGSLALDLRGKTSVSDTIKAIFDQPAIPLKQRANNIPQQVCEIIDRSLAKDPATRWQSAGAMRTALLHAA